MVLIIHEMSMRHLMRGVLGGRTVQSPCLALAEVNCAGCGAERLGDSPGDFICYPRFPATSLYLSGPYRISLPE